MSSAPTSSRAVSGSWIRVLVVFLGAQLALVVVTRGSFLPVFLPLGEVPYNVKWWLALGALMAREGPWVVWTPYPPVFPLLHLALFGAMGFDADTLWRHFFLRDAAVAGHAAEAIRSAQVMWCCMNAMLLCAIAWLVARLAEAARGRAEAWVAGGAYLLMSQSYASRVLTGVVSDQFDYLPCAMFLFALLALVRDAGASSAAAAAVGTATKLFPVVLAPLACMRLPTWRARTTYVGAFTAVSTILWLPLLTGGQRPVQSFLRFTGDRGAWESVWIFPRRSLPPWPSSQEMLGLFDRPYPPSGAVLSSAGGSADDLGPWLTLATMVAMGAVFAFARNRLRTPHDVVRAALLLLLSLLFFTKGFSSYFVQWFVPLLFVVYRAEVAALWFGAFLVVGNLEFVGDPASWPMYWPSLFLRHALLFALAVDQWRRWQASTARTAGAAV